MNWIIGILGIWVVVEPFLGFSVSWSRILLIITGLVIAVLGFWPKNGSAAGSSPMMGGGMHGSSGESHHEPPRATPSAGGPMGGQNM